MPTFTKKTVRPLIKFSAFIIGALVSIPHRVAGWAIYFTNNDYKLFSIIDSDNQAGNSYYSKLEAQVQHNNLQMREAYAAPGSTPNMLVLLGHYQYDQPGDHFRAETGAINLYGALESTLQDANITDFVSLLQQILQEETDQRAQTQFLTILSIGGGFVFLCLICCLVKYCRDTRQSREPLLEHDQRADEPLQAIEVLALSPEESIVSNRDTAENNLYRM